MPGIRGDARSPWPSDLCVVVQGHDFRFLLDGHSLPCCSPPAYGSAGTSANSASDPLGAGGTTATARHVDNELLRGGEVGVDRGQPPGSFRGIWLLVNYTPH
jgi:hypothetical protein